MMVVGDYRLSSIGLPASFVGGAATPGSDGGYNPNGTPGNQLINVSAFAIHFPAA